MSFDPDDESDHGDDEADPLFDMVIVAIIFVLLVVFLSLAVCGCFKALQALHFN